MVNAFAKSSCNARRSHTAELTRKCISDDRDNAYGPQGNQREGDAVIARNNVKIGRFIFDDVIHLRDVARCFFDGYHILEITCNAQGVSAFMFTPVRPGTL